LASQRRARACMIAAMRAAFVKALKERTIA
jgi:hypothetical protein